MSSQWLANDNKAHRLNALSCYLWNARSICNRLMQLQTFVITPTILILSALLKLGSRTTSLIMNSYLLTIPSTGMITRREGVYVCCLQSKTPFRPTWSSHLTTLKCFLFQYIHTGNVYCHSPVHSYHCQLNIISFLQSVISADSNSEDLILLGDFNLPNMKWDTMKSSTPQFTDFCDFLFDSIWSSLLPLLPTLQEIYLMWYLRTLPLQYDLDYSNLDYPSPQLYDWLFY